MDFGRLQDNWKGGVKVFQNRISPSWENYESWIRKYSALKKKFWKNLIKLFFLKPKNNEISAPILAQLYQCKIISISNLTVDWVEKN